MRNIVMRVRVRECDGVRQKRCPASQDTDITYHLRRHHRLSMSMSMSMSMPTDIWVSLHITYHLQNQTKADPPCLETVYA